jgi:phosphate-selective porin OprO/OprP
MHRLNMLPDASSAAGRRGAHWGLKAGVLGGLLAWAATTGAAEVTIGDGGSLRVVDGQRTFQIGGRIRMGTVFYDEDVTDLPTGVEIDQALLSLRADLGNGWMVNLSYEFVGGVLFDNSVTYSGFSAGDIQVGQFRPQIGLFDGGAWILFNQRSMIEQALTIPRTVGVGFEGRQGPVSYSLAVNGDSVDANTPGDDPLRYSGRLVLRPLPGTWDVFHVGLNGIYQETPETRINRFRVEPVSTLEDAPTLLQAVQSDADAREVWGGEVLWMHGPWSAQTEYMHARVDAPGDPEIDGFYVQAAYILGAERRYSEQSATVGRPFLRDPAAGAWEFALRYDTIDMASAGGGSADNMGLAIVRYFSNPLRLGASVTHSSIDGGVNGNEDILSVHLRLQWFL